MNETDGETLSRAARSTEMAAVQVRAPGGPFEPVRLPVPEPGAGEVLVRVEACGVCRSDEAVREATIPGLHLPRVPGHEAVGRVEAVGPGVTGWSPGDRAGIGWHGGHCGDCPSCQQGDFTLCSGRLVTGVSFDGGYAELLAAPQTALARVPEELEPAQAAPILCAGLTAFNALRSAGLRPGDRIAVQGLGGVGHLAVQIAARMELSVVAVSRTPEKAERALAWGAREFLDEGSDEGSTDAASALRAMGGAAAILATAPDSGAMSALVEGLAPNGRLLVLGIDPQPLRVPPLSLISRRACVMGSPSGHPREAEEAFRFCIEHAIAPEVETFPLRDAEAAWAELQAGTVRGRAVLLPPGRPDPERAV